MAESKELNKIKKMYGENFMKLCRELFPTILENEGLLTEILTSSFATNSRTLFEDIEREGLEEEFKNFVYNKVDVERKKAELIGEKTPYELLEEAGYDLYECNSEKEIQSFKKYYKSNEALCTFRGNRLNRCFVFWAVKKDAEKIKREDFESPKREDEYGTSVMSIQFSKGIKSTVSIKNRYNHTVNNPDATYGNDLDRIIPGLTQSFANLLAERGLELNNSNVEKFEIPGYTVAGDGKYYKYNHEINDIYYCPGNVIIDNGNVVQLESEKQVLMDYFILDKESKALRLYDENIEDCFIEGFKDIETIEMKKDDEKEKGTRKIIISKKDCKNPIIIKINKDNSIVAYKNEELTEVGNYFLYENTELSQLDLPSLTTVENDFLYNNEGLSQLELPRLATVGDCFLSNNEELSQLDLPNLATVGSYFLNDNKELSQLELPGLTTVGDYFLNNNEGLSQLELPGLTTVGDYFLSNNRELSQLDLPNLTTVGSCFLCYNEGLSQLDLPNLTTVGDYFLNNNEGLSQLDLPSLITVRSNFLHDNKELSQLDLPSLITVGSNFLHDNKELSQLDLPNLTTAGDGFLCQNTELNQLELPSLTLAGAYFLHENTKLSRLELPSLTAAGAYFLHENTKLIQLELPSLTTVGDYFLYSSKELSRLELPSLTKAGSYFFYNNRKLSQLELPSLTTVGNINKRILLNIAKKNKSRNHNKPKIDASKSTIDEKNIAELDKETRITTTEINWGKKVIEKVKSIFKRNEENQR